MVNRTKLDTLLDVVGKSNLELVGYEPGFVRDGEPGAAPRGKDAAGTDAAQFGAASLADAAVQLAAKADVVLCCLGLPESAESEGMDRSTLGLPANQLELLDRLAQVGKPVVVLLSAGGVVDASWEPKAQAVLYLGLGGQAGASAALDVLTGKVNPSGKLAETWPRSQGDVPCADIFPSDGPVAQYREGIYVGYRYYATAGVAVAHPFGFGLSYTHFSYSDLVVKVDPATGKGSASFTVTNTGDRTGAEVAQMYVSMPKARVWRPALELKGFAKIPLAPKESRRVTLPLDARSFAYFNVATGSWEVQKGIYQVLVGPSSAELPLRAQVELAGTGAPDPYEGRRLDSYTSGRVRNVDEAEFRELLGHELPSEAIKLDRNLCFRDFGHGRSPVFWLVAAVLRRLVKQTGPNGRPNLNALFVYNMPLRALAKNAGEFVSMGLVDALVREARGWGLAGIVPALVVQLAAGKHFLKVWLAWFLLPIVVEFLLNRVRNARGRKLLEQQDHEN